MPGRVVSFLFQWSNANLLGILQITYLNSVVMPDEADEESEDSPDEESGQENENEDDE